jgi:hypothetical protein
LKNNRFPIKNRPISNRKSGGDFFFYGNRAEQQEDGLYGTCNLPAGDRTPLPFPLR